MNAFRILLRLAVAVWFALFAVTAMAVTKHYSLLVQAFPTFTNGVVDTPVPMKLFVKNEAPPGSANSNIGSFQVSVVGVTIASIAQCSAGKCSVTGSTLTVTNLSAVQAQEIVEVDFTATSCGDAHWFATVYNGSGLTGQTFSLVDDSDFFGDGSNVSDDQVTNVACATANCSGATFVVSDSTSPSPTSLQYVAGLRSALNKDGTCAPTDYFVSNMLPSNGRLHFRWNVSTTDPNAQPAAVFRYTVNLPTSNAQVAWLNPDGSPATGSDPTVVPYFIPAPACLTNSAPAPYAQLGTAISKTATQITVVNSLPPGQLPSRPFPAVIGTERITVTQVTGNGTWTVSRGQGGTAATAHNANDAVMSTPLPILPAPIGPYVANGKAIQAQVCIIGAPVQNAGGTWTATFFDIGDAWTGIR